jgi:hypothetical protein
MKKVLALILMVVLFAAMGVTVFATPSSEAQGIVSGIIVIDGDDAEVSFVVNKIDGKVNKHFQESLTELKIKEDEKSLKVVGHYDIELDDDAQYPLTVTLNVLGVSDNSSVYILAQNGDEVVVITPEIKDGKLVFPVDEKFEKFAVVTDGKTANKVEEENDVISPQTADMSIYVTIVAFISLVAIAVFPKKIKD